MLAGNNVEGSLAAQRLEIQMCSTCWSTTSLAPEKLPRDRTEPLGQT